MAHSASAALSMVSPPGECLAVAPTIHLSMQELVLSVPGSAAMLPAPKDANYPIKSNVTFDFNHNLDA